MAFLRLLRLLRVTKLFGKVEELEVIMMGLVQGMLSVSWISILLIIVLFIYGVMGITAFQVRATSFLRPC